MLVLVFGMMVIGCAEDEGEPYLPFGGYIEITGGNYRNPVVGDTLTAISTKSGYGTPTWEWYRGDTTIGGANSNKYTVASSDMGHQLTVHATFSGYSGFDYAKSTVVVGTPQTAQVSLSSLKTYVSSSGFYSVYLDFTLSDGTWARSFTGDVKSWVTISGTPNVSDWRNMSYSSLTSYKDTVGGTSGQTIRFYFDIAGTHPNPNLTVSLDTSRFAEMKNSTNVIGSLSAGSPSTVTSSSWVQQ